jgi:primase-polymerase (primpol)-like protein
MALCGKLTFWANCDFSQIDRLFRLSGLMREKWDSERDSSGETYGQRTISKACVNATKTYTRKQKSAAPKKSKRPTNIYEKNGQLFVERGDSEEEFTNFIFVPKFMVASKEEGQIVCECITNIGETHEMIFQTKDFSTLNRFKDTLNANSIALCYFGTERELEYLKQYVYSLEWQHRKGVKSLGIYNHKETLGVRGYAESSRSRRRGR